MKIEWAILIIISVSLSVSAQSFEFEIYRDLATTHISEINHKLNNDNNVTIIKLNGFLAGSMINSYGNKGHFLGWQPTIYKYDNLSIDAGVTLITGYKKWQSQLSNCFNEWRDSCLDETIIAAPIFSASYELMNGMSLQLNNMGIVFNGGLKLSL